MLSILSLITVSGVCRVEEDVNKGIGEREYCTFSYKVDLETMQEWLPGH